MTKLSEIIASFIKGSPSDKKEGSQYAKDEINKYLNPIAKKDPVEDVIDAKTTLTGIEITDEFEEALKIVKSRNPFTFITGRAGTGKSTFTQLLKEKLRSYAVVAPTGVAALNVGGQTIHSFFRIAPGPIDFKQIKRVNNRSVYKALNYLIIDEISMVRADLLDAIDIMLRLNGNDEYRPFGGVPVIAVGDLYQLPPVVATEEEQAFILTKYKSQFFFSANAMKGLDIKRIEFTKVFRQSEKTFIEILNNIREGKELDSSLSLLNQRVQVPDREKYDGIILTGDNDTASRINLHKLIGIRATDKVYTGIITGKFIVEKDKLPAPFELVLKVGAQVMFVKNDRAKRWVNGTIGTVKELNDSHILVTLKDNLGERDVRVEKDIWENKRFEFNPEEKEITATVVGSYSQIPLTLAWAITIHKSQGKTFDKVHINLERGAFAEGQVYVALSRCRTFEGVSLQAPVKKGDIFVNSDVVNFQINP